ncbi:MAG: site-2 protease family protein [Patescibacteria group bacterium]
MIILFVVIGISVLILVHELGHFIAAKYFGLLVEEFGFGFPPRIFSKKIGETIYSFNLLPFGGYVKIYGENRVDDVKDKELEQRSFYAQKTWRKIIIILAGVAMNFLLGWAILSSVFMLGAPKAVVISDVLPGTPAAAVGLQAGDFLADFKSGEEFSSFIQANRGKEISLSVNRVGEQLSFKITPRAEVPEGQGALGVVFTEAGFDKKPFFESLALGFTAGIGIVGAIFISLGQLLLALFTNAPLMANFVGPIGIFGVANQAGSFGFAYLLQLIGLISLNLFALNIFPFPALDGGRLLFIIVEKIKGSPLSPKFERSANAAGFIFLIFLMIAVTVRDVARLF